MQIKQRQYDQYLQMSRSKSDQLCKEQLILEKYINILPKKLEIRLNHYLTIETDCWNNTPLKDGICTVCNKTDISDEFHYLFICICFGNARLQFLNPYYHTQPSTYKFKELMENK